MDSPILEAIFLTVPQAMLFMDNSGVSAWINHRGRVLLNLPKDTTPTVTPIQISRAMQYLRETALNRQDIETQWQRFLLTPHTPISDWIWRCTTPHYAVLSVSCVASTFRGVEGRLWVFHDITELDNAHQKLLEQHDIIIRQNLEMEQQNITLATQQQLLEKHNTDLQEANQHLDRLNKEKTELMGIVAHDLKNPLNTILGFAEVLQNGSTYDIHTLEQAQEAVSMIHRAGTSMLVLIKKILDANAIEHGTIVQELIPLSLHECALRSVEKFSHSAQQKNITLHYQGQNDIPPVLADEILVQQIIDNLLSNAIKFSSSAKDIFISITHLAPYSDDRSRHPVVRFSIRDQGPGFTDHDKSLLFRRYTKLSASPTAGENSTGLGLSIVKRMVDEMDARIWCESTYGQGATFHVEFLTILTTEHSLQSADSAS